MLNAKVTAVVAAVFVMSTVSAQAMEFADRPGMKVVSSMPALQVASVGDLVRRQIHQPNILGNDERTELIIVNAILAKLSETEGSGRLSAEFSPASTGFVNFEHRPIRISSGRIRYAPTLATMRFEDRPGAATPRLNTSTATTRKLVDGIVTSSLRKTKAPFGLHSRPKAGEFCVGSIAPCGSLNFAQGAVKQDS